MSHKIEKMCDAIETFTSLSPEMNVPDEVFVIFGNMMVP